MHIAGLQKLSLVDYPGVLAATVFVPGCDFRCPFCHNGSLVIGRAAATAAAAGDAASTSGADGVSNADDAPCAANPQPFRAADGGMSGADAGFPSVDEDAFWAFLDKRRGVLQGVCITGGEPLIRSGLSDFCARIKDMGYRVKLDTNGAHPQRLAALLDAGLIDYAAMDVKSSWGRYAEAAGLQADATSAAVRAVQESARMLMEDPVPYEFRTTVVRELHDAECLDAMADALHGARAWYLQRYVDSPDVLAGQGRLSAYDEAEMARISERLAERAPFVRLRGV